MMKIKLKHWDKKHIIGFSIVLVFALLFLIVSIALFIDEYSITIGFLLNAGNVTRYSSGASMQFSNKIID